jgi:CheY-like chemotaxis protein
MILEATDGQQAMERLRFNSFDLIVLDIKLPDVTGWELLAKLAADPTIDFGSPVLVMTASSMDPHIDLEQYPRVVEVLIKPFSAVKLVAAVERALSTTLSQHT